MKHVDVEVYMTRLIDFFERNPTSRRAFIPDEKRSDFYETLKGEVYRNYLADNKDFMLTPMQIKMVSTSLMMAHEKCFQMTDVGILYLN